MRGERRSRPGGATIEVKRRGTRTGIVIEVDSTSSRMDRVILSDAFDLAGRHPSPLVTDPGFWAACVSAAYVNFGLLVSVQRVVERLPRHVEVLVESSRLIEEFPDWPMVTLVPGAHEIDLRGEAALRRGPSEPELAAYAASLPAIEDRPSLTDLRRMFDMGVIGWEPGEPARGRRRLVVAP